jgi:hypothetical protein
MAVDHVKNLRVHRAGQKITEAGGRGEGAEKTYIFYRNCTINVEGRVEQ